MDLISYFRSDLDSTPTYPVYKLKQTALGRAALTDGKPTKHASPQKNPNNSYSVLAKIENLKQASLAEFSEKLQLQTLKVLSANYVDRVSGWDILALVQQLDQRRGWMSRHLKKGLPEEELLQRFVDNRSREAAQRAFTDLQQTGLLEKLAEGKSPHWQVTNKGKQRIEEGNPIETGALNNEVLGQILQQAADRLREQHDKETAALEKFEQDVANANQTMEGLKAKYETHREKAVDLLRQAGETDDTEKADKLKDQAAENVQISKELQYRMELEAEFHRLLKEQLTTAQAKYAEWSAQHEAQIRSLITTQARIRFTQVNQSIDTLMRELDALKNSQQAPDWANVVRQVDLNYYKSETALGDAEERRAREKFNALTNDADRDALLAELQRDVTAAPDHHKEESGTSKANGAGQ